MKQFTEALADSDHKMKKADSQVQTDNAFIIYFYILQL